MDILADIKRQQDNVSSALQPKLKNWPGQEFDDDEVDIIDDKGNTTMSLDKRKDYLVFMDGVKDGTIELDKPKIKITKKIVSVKSIGVK